MRSQAPQSSHVAQRWRSEKGALTLAKGSCYIVGIASRVFTYISLKAQSCLRRLVFFFNMYFLDEEAD